MSRPPARTSLSVSSRSDVRAARRSGGLSFLGAAGVGLPSFLAGLALLTLLAAWLIGPSRPEVTFSAGLSNEDVVTGAVAETTDEADAIRKSNEERYADGAIVMVRPELEELLRRAELFAAESSFRNATVLWTRVLEEGGSSLTTADAETYVPLADRVEIAISKLPAEGIAAYRIVADGEATALLAQSDRLGREAALSAVVERHFMSSLGDQAAFELSGYLLDRFDYVAATRLLEKIVRRHPDPDVPAGDLHLRLAVGWAALGDMRQSQAAFEQAVSARPSVAPEKLEAVSRFISRDLNTGDRVSADLRWGMPFGNSRRNGAMPSLPTNYLEGDLIVADSVELDSSVSSASLRAALSQFGGNQIQEPTAPISDALQRAQVHGWLPAQRAVLGPDGILIKSARAPIYYRANDAGQISLGWESLWYNMYLVDDASISQRVNLAMYGNQQGNGSNPTHPTELFLFGDTIHQSMTVVGGTAYVVEGQPYSREGSEPSANNRGNNQFFGGAQAIRRSRTNWLTAYDVGTGRLLWTRAARDSALTGAGEYEGMGGLAVPELAPDPTVPATEVPREVDLGGPNEAPAIVPQAPTTTTNQVVDGIGPDGLPVLPERGSPGLISNSVGYMGGPVVAGDLLVLPLTDSGSMHLQAISPLTGNTVWRTPLCDAPPDGAPIFSPIHIAVEGQDLYVTCGMGLLFAINAADGRVRFARRYERDPTVRRTQNNNNPFGGQMPVATSFNGWSEDVVLPFQGVIVVAASDSDRLVAFDRTNGEFVWTAPRNPFTDEMDYLLGVRGRYLYSAGRESILCYDLQGQGKLVWREQFTGESMGRGCLTDAGIYVPVQGSVVHYSFDAIPGTRSRKVAQVGVRGLGDRTLGNLYCDGTRLWTLVAGRLMTLVPASPQLESLEQQSEAGDARATWERAMLALETGQEEYVEELVRQAFEQWNTQPEPRDAEFRESVSSLQYLDVVQIDPARAGAAMQVLGLVASQPTVNDLEWIDRNEFRRRRGLVMDLAEQLPDEWTAATSRGWGRLLLSLPTTVERRQFAASLAPGPGRRDASLHMLGAEDEGRILLGLAWLDPVSTAQATDRLVSLSGQARFSEELRAGALERLLQVHYDPAIDLVVDAVREWQEPSSRLRVLRALEQATGERIAVDVLAGPDERNEGLNPWFLELRANDREISWREFQPSPLVRFDRLLVGFPNNGLVLELTSNGEPVRRHELENMVAVAADADGDRWVARTNPNRLERISVTGEIAGQWVLPAYPRGVAAGDSGELCVALDGLPGKIAIFRDRGRQMELFETSGESVDAVCPWDRESFLVAVRLSGRLQRWSLNGAPIESLPVSFISGVSRLDGGTILATSSLNANVCEIDAENRTVFRRSNLPQARAAVRTAEGLTVVAYSQGVVALDRDGQEVWAVREHGPAITLAYF
ncbi:MAG: PQQ-binding-like beta-propeller repeat protein [Planctomycetales bacterium]|nr:PQQ-binding-like beta-propeller repeat protein [Planctomycetales bacterium]